jgi:hypothetical protein
MTDKLKEAAIDIACQGVKMCIELKAERDTLKKQLEVAVKWIESCGLNSCVHGMTYGDALTEIERVGNEKV